MGICTALLSLEEVERREEAILNPNESAALRLDPFLGGGLIIPNWIASLAQACRRLPPMRKAIAARQAEKCLSGSRGGIRLTIRLIVHVAVYPCDKI